MRFVERFKLQYLGPLCATNKLLYSLKDRSIQSSDCQRDDIQMCGHFVAEMVVVRCFLARILYAKAQLSKYTGCSGASRND